MFNDDCLLSNDKIKLERISNKYFCDLLEIVENDNIWEFCVFKITSKDELRKYINDADKAYDDKDRVTFAIIDENGKAVGSTAICNYSTFDNRIEIGWSWVGKKYQGSGCNKYAKYLLISYCFDVLRVKRVEFKTDKRNKRAIGGLNSIGALEEGVLRSHTLMHTGHRRDTVYFSLLSDSWENIKNKNFKNISVC